MSFARVTAGQFVDALASRGRYHFTTLEAVHALGTSLPATRGSLRRLRAKGLLAEPHRSFHVIIPPEYRRLGCLPPEQFIPQLMEHLGEPYYVALLSAAELHGAAHQRPQKFQVMVKRNRRPISCGEVAVQFVARNDLDTTPVITRNTPRGLLRVASPEATALELVGYVEHCGGLDNVSTVVSELAEALEPAKLVAAARACPIAWAQRLGYLLDLTGHTTIAESLVPQVAARAHIVTPLVRARPQARAERLTRWMLAVNTSVEPDL